MADNAVTASTFSGWQKRFGVMLQEYVVSSCPLQRERLSRRERGGEGVKREDTFGDLYTAFYLSSFVPPPTTTIPRFFLVF